MKPILFPSKILKTPSSIVTSIEDIAEFAKILETSCKEVKGLGLAAPQVGLNVRIFAINLGLVYWQYGVLINPEIFYMSLNRMAHTEGCLSVPMVTAKVKRSWEVGVRFLTLKGELIETYATGLLATIIQHETDHLDGILFLDRLDLVHRQMLHTKLKRLTRTINKRRK